MMTSLAMRIVLAGGICAVASITKVAEWDVKNIAAISLAEDLVVNHEGPIKGKSVLATTFKPFGKDSIVAVPVRPGSTVLTLSEAFVWPNQAQQVPSDVMGKAHLDGSLIQVADGFLFPGKQTGGIHLLHGYSGEFTTVSEDKHAWFYHHSEWMDVDGDDVLDIVAARAIKPLLPWNKVDGELVWFKNNGDGTWGATQVITKGPDVKFAIADIDGDGKQEIVAAEFFLHQQLAIYSCPEATWAQCATKQNTVERVISKDDGPFFDVVIVDMNDDGRKDILATAQQYKANKNDEDYVRGKVLVFEQPLGGMTGEWTKHVIADGYLPTPKVSQGTGAPGFVVPFMMDARKSSRPHVVVSADDGGDVDLLTPSSEDPENWTYIKETLYTSSKVASTGSKTLGGVIVADVDGDSSPELFIASYSEDKLLMFKFANASLDVIV